MVRCENEIEFARLSELISGSLAGTLSEKEERLLQEWLNESAAHRRLYKQICDTAVRRQKIAQYGEHLSSEEAFGRFCHRRLYLEQRQKRMVFFRTVAAIILPLFMAGGLYLFVAPSPPSLQELAVAGEDFVESQFPVLVLSDGRQILLDSAGQEDFYLSSVTSSSVADTAPGYLEIRTPSQCDFHFVLDDGTKVWINAASVFRYPAKFRDTSRHVRINGEVYLEVKKDPQRPFVVETDQMKILVLGTAFNVNAYKNENHQKVTLVEGKVAAYLDTECYQLQPDHQLVLDRNSRKVSVKEVNAEDFIAWKDGCFLFKGQRLEEIARVVERWYDMKVVFENPADMDEIYTGALYKEEKINDFILRLNQSSGFHCGLEQDTIYIR